MRKPNKLDAVAEAQKYGCESLSSVALQVHATALGVLNFLAVEAQECTELALRVSTADKVCCETAECCAADEESAQTAAVARQGGCWQQDSARSCDTTAGLSADGQGERAHW